MLCDNCGKKEANVRYSENINGIKKELNLCEECSEKIGISKIDFSMPIDFSSFFGGFLENFMVPEFMPTFSEIKELKCNNCGYTFDNIVNTGKLGCSSCYDVFEERLDPIIKRIQGDNHHIGRIGKIIDKKIDEEITNNTNNENKKVDSKETKLEKLKEELKQTIKEERYEDAAKIRDEIKKEEQ